jgi:hypothetical protein
MTKTTNTTEPIRLLVDAREAAAALGVCEKTLWTHTRPRGTIPCIRIGKRTLYSVRDLERWIDSEQEQDGGLDP